MNWKLIFQLSVFGLAMAFLTISLIPTETEWIFWLGINILSAVVIARSCRERFFAHGFVLSVINGLWITAVHLGLYPNYIANHPETITLNQGTYFAEHPRQFILIFTPIMGAAFGLIQGILAWLAAQLLPKSESARNKPAAKKVKSKAKA